MSSDHNTLYLRLAGPMQSWGTSSRFQLRRTDAYPSKSGVLGLLLCAMGVSRNESAGALAPLARLSMGVRVDRCGSFDWDYHTAGAGIGIRSADGKIKKTASTGKYETLLSRRQYIYDASFLVALFGDAETIAACSAALQDPVWPVFLGRKCCIPAEPVFAGSGGFDSVAAALAAVPWQPRLHAVDCADHRRSLTLDTFIEHAPGSPAPDNAVLAYDVPRVFGFHSHAARWVIPGQVTVAVGESTIPAPDREARRRLDYASAQWKAARRSRLARDNHLCVFCKSPAIEVHHVNYSTVGRETDDDLRSLCKLCHDACTMLEYGHGQTVHRVDPADPAQRTAMLEQIERITAARRHGRRRELLQATRAFSFGILDDTSADLAQENR